MANMVIEPLINVKTGQAIQNVAELRKYIKDLQDDLVKTSKDTEGYSSTVDELTNAQDKLYQVMNAGKDTYKNQRQELAALKTQMDKLDESTEEYQKAFQRAAEITHNLSDRQALLRYSSSDIGDQLNNIRGIGASVTAGFSALNAVMGLFGTENEEVAKALLKVQQMMALVQGLQGMDGLLKRTQGLSNAIKTWMSTQTEVIATTKAQTVATNTQTVATEGATVAQRGLNAAMKANPIGAIITAVMALVAAFQLFTNWIKKSDERQDKFNKTMNKAKSILAGTAKALTQYLLIPIKEVINSVTTLGKLFMDLINLDFKAFKEDLIEGAQEAVDIAKNGLDVVGNYREGYQKKFEKLEDQRLAEQARKEAEAKAKDLNDTIKNNEAKLGSDWKYTQEGIKYYQDYFAAKLKMYSKDSDEYKEILREQMAFEKDQKDKADADEKARAEEAKRLAEQARQQSIQAQKQYVSTLNSIGAGGATASAYDKYLQDLTALKDGWMELSKVFPQYADTVKNALKYINEDIADASDNQKKYIQDLYDSIVNSTDTESLRDALIYQKGVIDWKGKYKNILEMSVDEMMEVIGELIYDYTNETDGLFGFDVGNILAIGLGRQISKYNKQYQLLFGNAITNAIKEQDETLNNELINQYRRVIEPAINKEIQLLENDMAEKNLKFEFDVEMGSVSMEKELANAEENFQSATEVLDKQLEMYEAIVKFVDNNGLIPSEEYDKAKQMIQEITRLIDKASQDYAKTRANIFKKYADEDAKAIADETAQLLREFERNLSQEQTSKPWYYSIIPENPKELKENLEEIWNIQVDGQKRLLEFYGQQKDNESLAFEDRMEYQQKYFEAQEELYDMEAEMDKALWDQKAQNFLTYLDTFSGGIDSIGNLYGSLADYYEADIQLQVKQGKMSEEQAKKQFERVKKARKSEAVIQTIAGSVGAFMQAVMNYPAPWGAIIGAAEAAATTIAGMAQIKKIEATEYGSSTSLSSAVAATPAFTEITPLYTKNATSEDDTDILRNAVADGMGSAQLFVSVSDIDDVQNKVKVTSDQSSF